MKILIADDDSISLDLLECALQDAGHEVTLAVNGREAEEVLAGGDHQMVIADWEMPEMTGIELCRRIRSANFGRYIYTILLTGHHSSEAVEGLTSGADDFLTKPFDPTEIQLRVRAGERILALESRDLIIFAMAKLAESRDTDTGEHLERVRSYARVIAQALQNNDKYKGVVTDAFVQQIYLTSPLHDIGKVAIPDCVLLKPARLNEREFEIMKEHTTIGARTLEEAHSAYPEADYLRMAAEIAATHHEWIDGEGYPAGLKGEAIPLAGRIVAVADVYDALTSKRVYKAAFDHDVARSILVEGSGSQFDPDIVDVFLESESEFLRIYRQFSDEMKPVAA